jgi:hypothetical protein
MKKFLVLFSVVVLFVACKNGENKTTDQNETASIEEAMDIPMINLQEFDFVAGKYVDQQVSTKGIVDHVCKHGGKKLFLVVDDASLHIDGEERFDEALIGSEIEVTGYVREFRVDEGYCLQMEEDNINSHSKGETDDELFERKKGDIAYYRDSMKVAEVDHLSYYSMEYVSLKEIKEVETK